MRTFVDDVFSLVCVGGLWAGGRNVFVYVFFSPNGILLPSLVVDGQY